MSLPTDYTVSEGAIQQARQCGFWGDPAARLRGLAARAAPTTHPCGNATYGPFVLLLQGRHILAITMTGPQPVDTRPVSACKLCGGLMTRPHPTILEGREGIAHRPCPRAFDPTQPLCDTKESSHD